jgi:hypothetical protein
VFFFIAQPRACPDPAPRLQSLTREGRKEMGVDAAAAAAAGKTKTRCDLCGGAAAVHCAADSAFLCLRCDARVHGANFLASRHQRRRLLGAADSTTSSASSGSCVSTADSAESTAAATARESVAGRRARAEAVLEGWATRLVLAVDVADPAFFRRRRAGLGRVLLLIQSGKDTVCYSSSHPACGQRLLALSPP